LWLHSLKVAQLLRSAACLHTNQSRSYLNHLVLRTVLVHVCLKIATTKFKILNNMALIKHVVKNGYENSSV